LNDNVAAVFDALLYLLNILCIVEWNADFREIGIASNSKDAENALDRLPQIEVLNGRVAGPILVTFTEPVKELKVF